MFVRARPGWPATDSQFGKRTHGHAEFVKGLTWKLGLITSLLSLPILMPFCPKDACYDRGGAVDASGNNCEYGPGRIEPLDTWSWAPQAWVYFLVIGSPPGLAIGALLGAARRRSHRSAA